MSSTSACNNAQANCSSWEYYLVNIPPFDFGRLNLTIDAKIHMAEFHAPKLDPANEANFGGSQGFAMFGNFFIQGAGTKSVAL